MPDAHDLFDFREQRLPRTIHSRRRRNQHALMGDAPLAEDLDPELLAIGRFRNDDEIILAEVEPAGGRALADDPNDRVLRGANSHFLAGGIGVMAIMTISVTERTREIGLRKALGARRREILFQFLAEAVVLTSLGGVLGIALGSAIGVTISLVTGFPVSLPWWSFAVGLGFSAAVGIFFGMVPAFRAARLDPIEALRHE